MTCCDDFQDALMKSFSAFGGEGGVQIGKLIKH